MSGHYNPETGWMSSALERPEVLVAAPVIWSVFVKVWGSGPRIGGHKGRPGRDLRKSWTRARAEEQGRRAMKDGRYQISFEDYARVEAINASMLNWYARSPAHCRMMLETEREATRSMDVGNAAHFALLEPERFEREVVCFKFDGRTKEGKKERADIANDGKIGLRAEDFDAALGMAGSLFTHPRVKTLWEQRVATEESVIWTDEVVLEFAKDGPRKQKVRKKARRDIVGPGWIADVKTAATIDRFSPWSVTDFGYYRQAAHYAEPDRDKLEHFFFFVVQSSPPFESAVFRLSDDALRLGREENEVLVTSIARSFDSGNWPRHVTELLIAEAVVRG